jgi:hypothetical protein
METPTAVQRENADDVRLRSCRCYANLSTTLQIDNLNALPPPTSCS